MELELKHLAPYLPYGLKFEHVEYDYSDKVNHNITKMESLSADLITFEDCSDYYFDADNCDGYNPTVVPILLPMSSLYTEMEDGKVHIVELAKIATGVQDWEVIEYQPTFGSRKIKFKPYLIAYNKEYSFRFFLRDKDFYLYDVDVARECTHQNQLDLFTYLFENHFDVFGLIDKGLALDKTKIK